MKEKDILKEKKIEAYWFLEKNIHDFEDYFKNNLGAFYGIDGNVIARWVAGTLSSKGYSDVLYFDISIEDKCPREMTYSSLKKQVEGRKVLLLKDGPLSEDVLFLIKKIDKIRKSGIDIQDIKVVTTKPYKWYPLEELEGYIFNLESD